MIQIDVLDIYSDGCNRLKWSNIDLNLSDEEIDVVLGHADFVVGLRELGILVG